MKDLSFNILKNNINIKDNNSNFIIDPECFFEKSSIYSFKDSKIKTIKIIIDKKKHEKFINIIDDIYNKCSEFIEKQDDFNPDRIINPLKKIDDDFYNLYVYITDYEGNLITNFYDINNNLIENNSLLNKTFSVYPAIHIEKISLNNIKGDAYINMTLKEGYINNIENKRFLDYKKMKKLLMMKNQ